MPWSAGGHRGSANDWYRSVLPATAQMRPLDAPSVYRRGGVYVVIGGAGGIGTAWSEYMIRAYGAHIIWIGRRQMDAAIAAKIESLARLGPAPQLPERGCPRPGGPTTGL